MATLTVHEGSQWTLRAWGDNSYCETLLFLKSLKENNHPDYLRLWVLIRKTGDHGPPRLPEKCHPLQGKRCADLIEFKASGGARIVWFYDKGRTIVMTHGFRKGANVERECDKAQTIRAQYLKEKEDRNA